MTRPQLEFKDGSREAIEIETGESLIGHGPACDVVIAGAGVAEKHLRLVLDAANVAWLENYEPSLYTVRNGSRLMAREKLVDGDTIDVGEVKLVYRSGDTTAAGKVSSDERTMIGSEMPAELKNFLKQQQAAKSAPAGAVVGRAEPEPPDNRTVQMAPTQLPKPDPWEDAPATVMDQIPASAKPAPASAKPAPAPAKPAPAPAAAAPPALRGTPAKGGMDAAARQQARSTMMGFPQMQTPVAPAPAPVKPAAQPPQELKTTMMEAPVLPPKPAAQAPQELKTTMMESPILPPKPAAPAPAAQAPQELKTTMMEAPILPPRPSTPTPPPVEAAAPKLVNTHYSTAPGQSAPLPAPSLPTPPVVVAPAHPPEPEPEPAPKPGYSTPPSGLPVYAPSEQPLVPAQGGGFLDRLLSWVRQVWQSILAKFGRN
jgi:hypothetical protein